jgi:ABC-2 type transport system permease protein
VAGVSSLVILVIGADADPKKLALLFVANLCLQIEIAAINFCISAFLKRGGLGIGLGITFGAYFLNILANLTEDLEFIKYITPYGYTDGSQIITDGALKLAPLLVGAGITALSVALAYARYLKKDIK